MSDRARLASAILNGERQQWMDPEDALELADDLIAKGYGVVHVVQATALEEAAAALVKVADEDWEISDVLDFLYARAEKIYDEGTKK